MTVVADETIFGRIITGFDVEQWVLALLKKWSGTYISEVERQHGYPAGTLQRVRGWGVAPSFDKWPEDQIPGVLVVSPGLVPPPVKVGTGRYRARWRVDVGAICSASTPTKSHEQAQMLIAAHKAIVIQRPSLEVGAIAADWVDEQYDPLTFDDTRSLYAGYASLAVEIDDVVSTSHGPTTPDDPRVPETDPWPPWQRVDTVDVDVLSVPVEQPLPKGDRP